MTEIFINNASSCKNITTLKELFRNKKWAYVEIEMLYNVRKGLPMEEDKENWPFKANLIDVDGNAYVVHIYTLTVGCGGSGSHDFASILEYFNIWYHPDDIFTNRKMDVNDVIQLKYRG